MRRHHKVFVLDLHVVDGRNRQISRHPLPGRAVVERDENTRFSAYIEQSLPRRIHPQHASDLVWGKPASSRCQFWPISVVLNR